MKIKKRSIASNCDHSRSHAGRGCVKMEIEEGKKEVCVM